MATAFLRVVGDPTELFPCDDPSCPACGPTSSPAVIHREPIEAARALAAELGLQIPALAEPIGSDAPIGRRYAIAELPRAIAALEALLAAAGEPEAHAGPREDGLRELARALAVFRAGRTHHRVVVMEV